MRDVIVAGNWKMHTTPADAGDLARTIAARTRVAGRDPRHLSAVRQPRRRPGCPGRDGSGRRHRGAERPSRAARARTPARSPRRCSPAWPTGSSSATPNAAATPARPTSRSAGSSVAPCDAGLRPILCVGERLEEREAGDAGRRRRAPAPGRPGRPPAGDARWGRSGDRVRTGVGDRDRAERAVAATRRRWRMSSARRSPVWAGPTGPMAVPILYGGSVTSANDRRVPGRARDRRRARRWRVAQAGRDGRHRGAGRTHGSGPQHAPR